ncbi:MAG: DUF4097 family beta strand repeat protein [Clostridia bacterium]|nr:DUF4097 family beta strand repeat protein [Clostridia bacterium]
MKKAIWILVMLCVIGSLAACGKRDGVMDETKTYEITSEIHSLDIRINAADFVIKQADAFSVESNLKYLSVSEKDGVLTIVDEAKSNYSYTDYPTLTLCIPSNTVFQDVDIVTGAAKLNAATLSANSIELELGAGDVRFENLVASSDIDIEGGAGEITVVSGTLNNLTLEMGVGELNLTARLLGESDLEFGVGNADLTLIGSKNDYKLNVEKGLTGVSVDGNTLSANESYGTGPNHIEIQSGVGSVKVTLKEVAAE